MAKELKIENKTLFFKKDMPKYSKKTFYSHIILPLYLLEYIPYFHI